MTRISVIELYGMHSPNVRKVGILLEELQLDYRLQHVAVFRGDQFEPEFLAMNPLGKVPVLVDHNRGKGKPLFESGAILLFLAETYGDFMPVDGMDRHEVMSWLMLQMANIGPMLGQYNHFQLLQGQVDPYATSRYRNQARRLYRLLDGRLADHDWIAADRYTVADIAIYPWATYLEQHGFDPKQHPNLLRWRDTIKQRPAIERSSQRFSEAFNREAEETRKAATRAQLDRFFGREQDMPEVDFSAVTRS